MYLNTHSYYSLRYGTLSPERLLQEASRQGIRELVLTDINNTSGFFDLLKWSVKYGITIRPGIDFRNGAQQMYIGIAKNHAGFAELNRFLSEHLKTGTPFPEQAPAFSDSILIYPFDPHAKKLPGGNAYSGIRKNDLTRLAFSPLKKYRDRLVALLPVTFGERADYNVHRILRAIDGNILISRLEPGDSASPEECFLPYDTQREIFADAPYLLKQAEALPAQCSFDFDFRANKNKRFFTGSEQDDIDLLTHLTFEGLHNRYARMTKKIYDRVQKELDIITQKGFVSYFLINWDIIRFARENDFFCIGRGSGANSLIAYCLRITDVDPIDLDLYFERFINLFRETPPDFDLDFSWKDRDAITEYIFTKHGEEHTALLATFSTFRERSFIREIAKTFGLPKQEIDGLIHQYGEMFEHIHTRAPGKLARTIYKYGQRIRDFPNHLSIHAGGILISEQPIYYYTATHLPPKGFPTTQFDMYTAEDISLYKFDILSQRGLGHIREAVELVRKNRGIAIDIHRVSDFKNDTAINTKLAAADAIGCFYIESPAMRGLMKKLQVDNYLTLVAASSIIRPGVARSGMMREFIVRHRFPEERKKRMHPVLGDIMPDTYGVMVYQEDVIKVAHYFAGLSLAEADVLRRGMSGKYRSADAFEKLKEKYFVNCREAGYDEALIADVWHQVESFAGYSFAKGHSASYAVESYMSLYLKTYFPLEFMVAVINNFGGFYGTELYVQEARRLGARTEAPCVNKSLYYTTIYGETIYLGFVHVKGLEQKTVEHILSEREKNGAFSDFGDFLDRVELSLEQTEILITLNAFRFSGIRKQKLLIEAYRRMHATLKTRPLPQLFKSAPLHYEFPELYDDARENMWDELRILGFTLSSPFLLVDDARLESVPCIFAREFPQHLHKQVHIIGYYVTTKITSTIHGERMYFGTFLDREGEWIDTVHFPPVAKKYPFAGRFCYLLSGKVVEDFGVYTLEVSAMERLHIWTGEGQADAEQTIRSRPGRQAMQTGGG